MPLHIKRLQRLSNVPGKFGTRDQAPGPGQPQTATHLSQQKRPGGTSCLESLRKACVVIALGACVIGLTSCATVQRATNTQTYIISPGQLQEIKNNLRIPDCPDMTTAVAIAIEAQSGGGATLTVRCQ